MDASRAGHRVGRQPRPEELEKFHNNSAQCRRSVSAEVQDKKSFEGPNGLRI